ncbi:acyl-CoA dehydrogenase family protein [Mycobacteroides abscessus]|uniref:acyl-CoA dehydrogenase family protein n=1 Tax=Mycobacteroides abscessus TaxID=36809 RepID=UPI002102A367|nr:acyl-CoA dehydrogenase family protein [Mycobacteroides abscessus]
MTAPIGVDPALVAMMNDVFADYRATHPVAGCSGRDAGLWDRLADLGLVRLTGAEACGGSGASWYEAAELLTASVRHAVRIPLAEHDLLACWLLNANGMTSDSAVRTVCQFDPHGVAVHAPWADGVDHLVAIWRTTNGYRMADSSIGMFKIATGFNVAGEPRNRVVTDLATLQAVPVPAELVATLQLKSALVRSIQVCAALERILELSIEHATLRLQFGRPLSRFQTVQNLIADMAAESALSRAATESALTVAVNSEWSAPNLDFLVAVARSCAGHASSVLVRNAHQVHGAIGTTREHPLHEFTRAALAWRSEFGSVQQWDQQVTDAALRVGAAGLWSLIAG